MMDQCFQDVFPMQTSSDASQFFFGLPQTPETLGVQSTDYSNGYSQWQTAMTPYVVPTPPRLVRYSLPSLPETPTPMYPFQMPPTPDWVPPTPVYSLPPPPVTTISSENSLLYALGLPASSPPPFYSGGENLSLFGFSIEDLEFPEPLLPLRMDADFWASNSNSSGTGLGETQTVEMAQAPQLEFHYETFSDESSESSEMETESYFSADDGHSSSGEDDSSDEDDCMDESPDYLSEDDGYYASGEDSSSDEEFDDSEVHTPTAESQGFPATLATSSDDSLVEPRSPRPSQLGLIRKPLTCQGREYEMWLESQDEPSDSTRSASPVIHAPVPRRLVQWDSLCEGI